MSRFVCCLENLPVKQGITGDYFAKTGDLCWIQVNFTNRGSAEKALTQSIRDAERKSEVLCTPPLQCVLSLTVCNLPVHHLYVSVKVLPGRAGAYPYR